MRSNYIPLPGVKTAPKVTGIIGIGNTLMGDDGAGIVTVQQMARRFPGQLDLFFHELRHDLFEMADLLERAQRFIFIDVYLGRPAGTLSVFPQNGVVPLPSLHQTDITTVMHMLEPLGLVRSFPSWETWGILVEPPFTLGDGLSAPVASAVERLVERLCQDLKNKES